ncbi:MAG: DEAD/DEAH box helicase, partial [Bacteroidetes bacterium]|nr:DEAD/DEAH box helicase [Bacteroidota bacterium]
MITALEKKLYEYLRKTPFYQTYQKEINSPIYVEGLEGLVLAVFAKLSLEKGNQKTWLVLPTEEEASNLMKNLKVLGCEYVRIESTGLKLYSEEVHDSRTYNRINTFSEIQNLQKAVIISSLRAFSTPVPSPEYINNSKVSIKTGDAFNSTAFADELTSTGLLRVPATTMPGEFSVRGEVMDIYPFDSEYPIRIYIDWDTIEKISYFDPLGQETIKTLDQYSLYLQNKSDTMTATKNSSIDSYIDKNDLVILMGEQRLEASYESIMLEAKKMFREAYLQDQNVKRPDDLLFSYTKYINSHNNTVVVEDLKGQNKTAYTLNVMGPRSYFGNFNYFKNELKALKSDGYSITIFSGSINQAQRLQLMLKDDTLSILSQEISEGLSLPEDRVIVICDHEIFGRRKKAVKILHHSNVSPLDTFVDLDPGDYVVHINYGIGKFKKIDRIKALGKERDYIQIEYSDNEDIFIPIEQANLIQRYIGKDGSSPRLDKLGGTSWETKKKKAKKSAEDLAERLIHLYARRKQAKGTAFPKDTDWQLQFEAMFPYDETEDQISCIQDVKNDMEQPLVMDRLICGDVGYGKTEIAIRAAFKAVMAGKQVSFLAPTTILAEQHYDTITERIGSFPMRVGMLSRLVEKKDQRKILKKMAEGQIDILIGTHRIIQKDVKYKDLGLLIIDEEQRFGVKDKEKIKEIKASVDCMALSATPIPRTLYMSLLKIRDMSLLATPPIQRRAINTIIQEFDEVEVRKAILHETQRGGQVFYLHNRIETLDRVVSMLTNIVPEVSIDFAHGQMQPEKLEEKMRMFVHNGFQVLVAT